MRPIGLLCMCPKCKVLETCEFMGDKMLPTKRFKQIHNGEAYHDCGSTNPCRLFHISYREFMLARSEEDGNGTISENRQGQ